MKPVLFIILALVVIAVVVIAVALSRFGRRSYQRHSGLEEQRAAAKQLRDVGVDRLKDAERELVQAQRALISGGRHEDAQRIERLRLRLSTVADRHRFAVHGYAPIGDANPIREAELAALQARDAEAVSDAQLVNDLARGVGVSATGDGPVDLGSLEAAVDHLVSSIDQRKALT